MISFCDKTFNPADRWGERNGTGYWMVGPVDDLSDKVFLEENSVDMDTIISSYTPTRQGLNSLQEALIMEFICLYQQNRVMKKATFLAQLFSPAPRHSGRIMRGFCLKKIYPGLSTSDDVTCIR